MYWYCKKTAFAKQALRFFLYVVGCALLLSPRIFCQDAADASAFTQSLKLFSQGKFEEAKAAAAKVLAQHPDQAFGLNFMGTILDRLNEFAEAETYFQRALKLAPNSPAILNNLGSHYLLWGKKDLARAYFVRVVNQQPGHFNANYELARLAIESEDAAAAEQSLSRMSRKDRGRPEVLLLVARILFIQKQPERARQTLNRLEASASARKDPAVAFSAGMIYYRYGHYREAADMFSTAVQLAPEDFEAQYNSGLANQRLGRFGLAEQALKHAVRLQPGSADALYHLALVYSQDNDPTSALVILAKLPHENENAECLNLRAHLYERSERFKEALEDYQRAIQLAPSRESYYVDLIIFLIDTHADDAAQKALQAARQIFPESRKLALVEAIYYALAGNPRRAYESLQEMDKHWPADSLQATVSGLVASFMGDRTVAAARMKKAIELGSTDPLPYYYLGLFESQSPAPNLDAALGWVETAVARDPSFASGHLLCGELLLKLGKPVEALKSLKLASRLEPNAFKPHYLLGRVYQKLGEPEQSEKDFKESERLRSHARAADLEGAERQLLVRIQTGP